MNEETKKALANQNSFNYIEWKCRNVFCPHQHLLWAEWNNGHYIEHSRLCTYVSPRITHLHLCLSIGLFTTAHMCRVARVVVSANARVEVCGCAYMEVRETAVHTIIPTRVTLCLKDNRGNSIRWPWMVHSCRSTLFP